MATHSSILAWKGPWMEEPGRLQSLWSQRVVHNRATSFHITKSVSWGSRASQVMLSQFSHSVVSDFFWTPRTAAPQASLSITNSQSLLKLMSIELVMPSCCSHTFWVTNSLRRTMQIVECSLLYQQAQRRVSS